MEYRDDVTYEGWDFNPVTRILTVGQVPCTGCGYRTQDGIAAGREIVFPWIACQPCKGTGRRGNGRCQKCQSKYGGSRQRAGEVRDTSNPVDGGACTRCDGTLRVHPYQGGTGNALMPEHIRLAVWACLPIDINPRLLNYGLSAGERLMGWSNLDNEHISARSMFTVSDYGRLRDELAGIHRNGGSAAVIARLEEVRQDEVPKIQQSGRRVCEVEGVMLSNGPAIWPTSRIADCIQVMFKADGRTVYMITKKEALPS